MLAYIYIPCMDPSITTSHRQSAIYDTQAHAGIFQAIFCVNHFIVSHRSGYPLVICYSLLMKITIYSWFTHKKWWFSIAMLDYQRVMFVFLGSPWVFPSRFLKRQRFRRPTFLDESRRAELDMFVSGHQLRPLIFKVSKWFNLYVPKFQFEGN